MSQQHTRDIPAKISKFSACETTPLFDPEDFLTERKQCYEYCDGGVFILLSRRGNALEAHIAAEGRKGRRNLRLAASAMLKEAKKSFPWLEMLIATVTNISVLNMCKKIGMEYHGKVGDSENYFYLMVYDYGQHSK